MGKRLRLNLRQREALTGMSFASIWMVGFLVFTLGPLIASLYYSFTWYEVLRPPRFIGLSNYRQMFDDRLVWLSLYNTMYITVVGVPLRMLAALIAALLLSSERRGIAVYRTAFYLPSITPIVAASVLWMWLLNGRFGLVNALLSYIGIQGPSWLTDPVWSKPGIILMTTWAFGANMIIYLAGLKGIPGQLYESAEIDGANYWTKLFRITLPLLTPALFYTLVINVIHSLRIFAHAYIMTGGGPVNSTLFFVYYLFNNAFSYFKMGYASALAWLLFLVILFITLLQLRLSRHWVYYDGNESEAKF